MSGFAYGVYLVVTVQITIYEFLKYLIWNTVNNFRNNVFCVLLDFVLQRGHNYIIYILYKEKKTNNRKL